MKRGMVAAIVVLMLAGVHASAAELTEDQLAVKQAVDVGYVDGVFNFRQVEAVRQGFHPGFEMLAKRDDELEKTPISFWLQRLEEHNAKEPLPPDAKPTTTASYPLIDVTDDVAVCEVELRRDGNLIYSDYLLLYRFAEGWKIVSKAFHRH